MTLLKADNLSMTVTGIFHIKEKTGFFWFWRWQFGLMGCADGFRFR